MIDPALALEGIREQLREVVLPKLEDEKARAVVFAVLGIVGDLTPQIRRDDDWSRDSIDELTEALERVRSGHDGFPAAPLEAAISTAGGASSPASTRAALLEEAELTVRTLWESGAPDREALAELRAVLASDLARQLEHTN